METAMITRRLLMRKIDIHRSIITILLSIFFLIVLLGGLGCGQEIFTTESKTANTVDLQSQLDQARQELSLQKAEADTLRKEFNDLQERYSVLVNELQILKSNIPTLGKAWMGVSLRDNQGILVADVVRRSPAERAGILRNSRITHIDGMSVLTVAELLNLLSTYYPAQDVQITFNYAGQSRTVVVTLGVAP